MAPITNRVEIDRSPADVFAYVTDPSRFAEWQDAVVSASLEGDAPVQQGSKMRMTRTMGWREQTMTAELTQYEQPHSYAFRVTDGPVRALGKGRLESLDDGQRTRFTFEIDFEGHGIGRLLVPLMVRRQAKKELMQSHKALKQRLESDRG